jgi:membrane protein DedA with SNARE-associated domain
MVPAPSGQQRDRHAPTPSHHPVLTALLDAAATWPVPVVLAVAGALLVVESGALVGIVLPGSTLLVGLGLWSLTAPDALIPAVVAAAAATVTGSHLGWLRGRSGAPAGRADGRIGRLAAPRVQRASAWLAERGQPATGLLLACGHWAAAARPVLPRVAGAAGVPYRTAGPALVLSGTAWATTLVLLANRFGAFAVTTAAWVPVVLVALLVTALVFRSRVNRRTARRSSRPFGRSRNRDNAGGAGPMV